MTATQAIGPRGDRSAFTGQGLNIDMGIDVSATKAVTINDTHEDGVDTSIDNNPLIKRFQKIPLLHVFSRNRNGSRRDDGNPLIYAIKGKNGFSIEASCKNELMLRATAILEKSASTIQPYDFVLPVPSTSPFCAEFAALVSATADAPLLSSDFIRKRRVADVLAQVRASPPRIRDGLKTDFASLLHGWERTNADALYEAKHVSPSLRKFFNPFNAEGDLPEIGGRRILVVDDIFATGSSLSSVREIVGNQLGAEVGAIFFLSGT